jgi:outer membrane protein, heavy metal efflux system
MHTRTIVGPSACLAFILFSGCAAVDPRPDYQRARKQIAASTGQTITVTPDDDAAINEEVKRLATGGVTIEAAVRIALLNNAGLQAAWMDIGMARADLVQAGLLSNPSLGGSLRLPAGGGLANLEAGLAQNIADLWQIPLRQRAAQAALEQSILSLARKAADLAADTRSTYVRCLGSGQLHEVARENLAVTQQLLDLALGRQQAGAGSELDVNLSRGAVLEAELAVQSARLAADEDRRALSRLLGTDLDAGRLALSDRLPESPGAQFEVARLIARAHQSRLDLRAAEQAVAQAEARVKEESLRVFRSVQAGVALERAERQRGSGGDEPTDFIIGPSWDLELPIFDQNQAQIAKADYTRRQVVKTLDSLERMATQDVRSALDQMNTAWAVVDAYRDRFIPLAQKNLELSRESYTAGRASFLSVLEAQRFHLDTRRKAIEAARAAAATIPELERATGTPFSDLRSLAAGPVSSRPDATRPTGAGQ